MSEGPDQATTIVRLGGAVEQEAPLSEILASSRYQERRSEARRQERTAKPLVSGGAK
jgi:hypothetical protein